MKIAFFSLGLLLSLAAFTQSKEYIVLHCGDTVTGKVKILTKQISVIKAPADTIVFNSEDVWLFVKNNKSKTVLRLILYGYTDNIEEVQLFNYRDPVYDTTILLTPVISDEKLNLFTGKDKRGVIYFFVQRQHDSIPVQLLYAVGGRMPEKASWGGMYQFVSYISHFRIFESQLREITEDCEYITEGHLQMLNYMESSLKAFIKRYNKKCI